MAHKSVSINNQKHTSIGKRFEAHISQQIKIHHDANVKSLCAQKRQCVINIGGEQKQTYVDR